MCFKNTRKMRMTALCEYVLIIPRISFRCKWQKHREVSKERIKKRRNIKVSCIRVTNASPSSKCGQTQTLRVSVASGSLGGERLPAADKLRTDRAGRRDPRPLNRRRHKTRCLDTPKRSPAITLSLPFFFSPSGRGLHILLRTARRRKRFQGR